MIVYELSPHFRDRTDAGRKLADKLAPHRLENLLLLAVPHGGIPVSVAVAEQLKVPLDVIVVRKIPIPFNTEAGYGAVADDGTVLLNEPLTKQIGLTPEQIQQQAKKIKQDMDARNALFRGKEPLPNLEGKTIVLIDDGLASGFTMLAAAASVNNRGAKKVIVAVPVASSSACDRVSKKVDEVICCIIAKTTTFAVASFYHRWSDLSDEEVREYLRKWKEASRT